MVAAVPMAKMSFAEYSAALGPDDAMAVIEGRSFEFCEYTSSGDLCVLRGERLGERLRASPDRDGDGLFELLVLAPESAGANPLSVDVSEGGALLEFPGAALLSFSVLTPANARTEVLGPPDATAPDLGDDIETAEPVGQPVAIGARECRRAGRADLGAWRALPPSPSAPRRGTSRRCLGPGSPRRMEHQEPPWDASSRPANT